MSAEVRRAELVQAALRVMSARGLAAGTTRAIVAEAGMSLATFHYCFHSRTDLLRELFGTDEPAPDSRPAPPGEDFRTTLRRAIVGYLEHLAENAENPGRELFVFELTEHALRTPELTGLAQARYRRRYEAAERFLRQAAEGSGMTWQLDPPTLARLMVIMMDGAAHGWLVDRDTERTAAALETVVDHLATLAGPSTRSR